MGYQFPTEILFVFGSKYKKDSDIEGVAAHRISYITMTCVQQETYKSKELE